MIHEFETREGLGIMNYRFEGEVSPSGQRRLGLCFDVLAAPGLGPFFVLGLGGCLGFLGFFFWSLEGGGEWIGGCVADETLGRRCCALTCFSMAYLLFARGSGVCWRGEGFLHARKGGQAGGACGDWVGS